MDGKNWNADGPRKRYRPAEHAWQKDFRVFVSYGPHRRASAHVFTDTKSPGRMYVYDSDENKTHNTIAKVAFVTDSIGPGPAVNVTTKLDVAHRVRATYRRAL
jgi:hypothetical protein